MSNMRSGEQTAKSTSSSGARKFLREMKEEVSLISWPSKDEVVRSTMTVLGVSAIIGVLVFVADQVFTYGLTNFILNQ